MISQADVGARLGQQAARLTTLMRRDLAEHGVSVAAARTLATLDREGPRRLTELAAIEQVTQPSMSALVARLEVAGLVGRESDPSDRRLAIVTITEQGRARLKAIIDRRSRLLSAQLARLPARERLALAEALPALDHLVELLEARTPVA